MWKFNNLVPFRTDLYQYSSHHYLYDERVSGGEFNFLRALGQWDAQWYLKIADQGYPKNPTDTIMANKTVMDGLSYAFFPLYPILLAIFNMIFGYIELSAFIFSLILLGANFYSLYFVVSKIYNENIAYKTVFLLFLFPFSIFYRSYFAEGLFLLILTWFSYFLIKREWLKASLFQGLLMVTKPHGLFLLLITLPLMIKDIVYKKQKIPGIIYNLVLVFVFFTVWLIYNKSMTGNYLYWKEVQLSFFSTQSVIEIIRHNFLLIISLFKLPLHDMHASRIDLLVLIYTGMLLYSSRKYLLKELWSISFFIWLIPMLIKDPASYSRYQIVSFPIFIYLASTLDSKWFNIISSVFYGVLLVISLYFVNWYWIG